MSSLPLLVYAAAIGAIFGSYGGVVASRGWRGSVKGRSECVCGTQLRWFENIPVIAWVVLGGRARCCAVKIPVSYFIGETLSMLAGAVLAVLLGPLALVLAPFVAVFIAVGACSLPR